MCANTTNQQKQHFLRMMAHHTLQAFAIIGPLLTIVFVLYVIFINPVFLTSLPHGAFMGIFISLLVLLTGLGLSEISASMQKEDTEIKIQKIIDRQTEEIKTHSKTIKTQSEMELVQRSPKVFLSYSRDDCDKVEKIYRTLKLYDIDVFMDVANVPTGDNWKHTIIREISDSNIFIPVISMNHIKSVNCQQEIGMAIMARKKIIPLAIDEVDPIGFINDIEATKYGTDAVSMSILAYDIYEICATYKHRVLSQEQGIMLNLFVYGGNKNTKKAILDNMVSMGMNKFLATTLGDIYLRSKILEKDLRKAVWQILEKEKEFLPPRLRDNLGLYP